LTKLGGARAIIATAFDAKSQSALIGGLGPNGVLLSLGVDAGQALSVPGLVVLGKRASVKGWYSGTAKDAEDTCKFAAISGVKVKAEVFPFEKFKEAYARMASGKAIFRVVLSVHHEGPPAAATTTPATAAATTTTATPAKTS